MNNILVSYTLYAPGQNYTKVIDKIKTLGSWAHVQESFWYLKCNFDASQVAKEVWSVMDGNDSLYVVNASNNSCAWYNLKPEVAVHINNNWNAVSLSNR